MWSWHQHCKTFYAGTDGLRHKLRQNFNVVGSAFFTATNSLRWTLINASNFCHNLGQNSNSYGVESFDSFDRVLFNALLTAAIFGLRQSSDHATAASVIWRICHSNCIIGAISSDYFRLIRFNRKRSKGSWIWTLDLWWRGTVIVLVHNSCTKVPMALG